MINITKAILNVIESIQPFDDLEALHVQDASNWIRIPRMIPRIILGI